MHTFSLITVADPAAGGGRGENMKSMQPPLVAAFLQEQPRPLGSVTRLPEEIFTHVEASNFVIVTYSPEARTFT